jgi:hypothetical protein
MANYAVFGYIETSCPNYTPFFTFVSQGRIRPESRDLRHHCDMLVKADKKGEVEMLSIQYLNFLRLRPNDYEIIKPYAGISIDCGLVCWEMVLKPRLRFSALKRLAEDLPGDSILRVQAANECFNRGIKYHEKGISFNYIKCPHCEAKQAARRAA